MAGEVSGAVLACGPVFKGALRHTLTALGDHADPQGRCYPSVKALAWSAGVSERQVIRDIAEAERLGLVIVDRRRGKGINHYVVNVALLQGIADRLRAEKRLVVQRGGEWFEACDRLAAKMREALLSDPASFSPLGFKGDSLSPQDDSTIVQIEAFKHDRVSPQTCQGVTSKPETCHGVMFEMTPDVMFEVTSGVTLTVNNLQEPSTGRAEAIGEKPIGFDPLIVRRLGEGEREAGQALHPPRTERADLSAVREAHERVERLATELGMSRSAVCIALGSLAKAERLSLRWATGEITLDAARAELALPSPVAPERGAGACSALAGDDPPSGRLGSHGGAVVALSAFRGGSPPDGGDDPPAAVNAANARGRR